MSIVKYGPVVAVAILALVTGRIVGVQMRNFVDWLRGCEVMSLAGAESDPSWMSAGAGMKLSPDQVPLSDFSEELAKYQRYVEINRHMAENPVQPDYVPRPAEFEGFLEAPAVDAPQEYQADDESCFLEGKCARRYSCVRSQVAPPGGQPVCMDFLRAEDPSLGSEVLGCVAYSFSLSHDIAWEKRLLEQTPCEVFFLNPGVTAEEFLAIREMAGLRAEHLRRIQHHEFGLEGMLGPDATDDEREEKELSFGAIKTELGHTRRVLQIVRVHCDGCEFRLLEINAMNKPFRMVRQLVLRFFKSQTTAPAAQATVKSAFKMLQALVERQSFELFHHEAVDSGDPAVKDVDITFIMPRW